MKRREFLVSGTALGLMAAAGRAGAGGATERQPQEGGARIAPPAKGGIPVAVAISEGVTVIDFAGPWEVFQDVMVPERGGDHANQMPFELFTVSERKDVVVGSGGLRLVPDHTFESAPQPKVIVVPAQAGSKALHAWLRKASEKADLTMSVCTGAFQLARAGLLSGKSATTHHDFTDSLQKEYPDIRVQRGLRFVENGRIATAGGLTSGIDLALRVVERYFGRPAAERTAAYMEYQSRGWMV
jgi:transcriptional regulator GlxA family with amidase domain